jgi:hypothetical protein
VCLIFIFCLIIIVTDERDALDELQLCAQSSLVAGGMGQWHGGMLGGMHGGWWHHLVAAWATMYHRACPSYMFSHALFTIQESTQLLPVHKLMYPILFLNIISLSVVPS